MAEELSFDELIRDYKLDREEIDALRAENESNSFTRETLKRRVAELQAIKTASKDPKNVSFDEIQDAWDVLKDVKDDNSDERLVKAKADMQKTSEQVVQNALETDPAKKHFMTDSMETAPELSEWLKINDSLGLGENKERNQDLGARLDAFYSQYDSENGLTGVTAEQSAQIAENRAKLGELSAAFDPEAKGPDGKPVYGGLAALCGFFDRLDIVPAADGGESIDSQTLKDKMLKLARDESIAELSVNKEFASLSPEDQAKKFIETYNSRAQMGMVALLTNHYTNGETGNFAQLDGAKQEEVKNFINNSVNGNNRIAIRSEVALATLATAENTDKNFNKRITQKTGVRGFFAKAKERHAKLAAKYPKTMAAVSIISNIGLSVGVNVMSGGVGLAVLGAYKTAMAIKKANEERKKANENSEKKLNFAQYVWKNPRHMVGIVGGAAGAVISGVGGVIGGLDANGLIGQSINHGFSATMDNFTSGITSVWDGVKDKVTGLFSGNAGDAAAAAADTAKESASWDTMKIVRVSRTAAVGAATFALDMKDVFKPENKGKRWKAFTKALFKSSLTGGAIYATTSMGFGEHNSAAHDHVSADETAHTPDTHDTAHTSDGAEAAADTMDFEHANETQLNRTFDADPRGVNAILNDGKFHTSAELHQMMEKNEFSDDQLKAIHGLALKDFDEKGHIIDPELKAYYENLARQSHVASTSHGDSKVDEIKQDEIQEETAPVNQDLPKEKIEETHDETYYQEQQDALKPKGEQSLESEIKMAVKSDVHNVEETVDSYMARQVEAERLTEPQGEQLGNYVKYELDAHDGNQNGTIEEENLSNRGVHDAMKDVKSTLNSMKENADEIAIAENVTYKPREDLLGPLPESHSHDTHNSQFYRGMSEVTGKMVGHSNEAGSIMRAAVATGRISEEQATAMNTRWAELRGQGQSPERALKTMVKDYDNHAKFYEAQEMAHHKETLEGKITENTNLKNEETFKAETTNEAPNVAETPGQDNVPAGEQPVENADNSTQPSTPNVAETPGQDNVPAGEQPVENADNSTQPSTPNVAETPGQDNVPAGEQSVENTDNSTQTSTPVNGENTADQAAQIPDKFKEGEALANGESKQVITKEGYKRLVGKDAEGNLYTLTAKGNGAMALDVPKGHPLYDTIHSSPRWGSEEWMEKDKAMNAYINHLRHPEQTETAERLAGVKQRMAERQTAATPATNTSGSAVKRNTFNPEVVASFISGGNQP